MAGFCSENSKWKVFLIANDEKQVSLSMSLTEALYAVRKILVFKIHSYSVWYKNGWILLWKFKMKSVSYCKGWKANFPSEWSLTKAL